MNSSTSFRNILAAFCCFIGLLLFVRFFYSGHLNYLFLVWNIFLASVPFFISGLFRELNCKSWWRQLMVFCSWLIFFPNALYIVTDLIHLEQESKVPKWFDAVLIFSSSVVGLMMAFISLHRAEKYLQQLFKRKIVAMLVGLLLFLGSFGVYLGRFLRWNSWDILSNPFQLIPSIAQLIISPLEHFETWGITFMLTALFYLLYIAIKKMPGYLSQANT